MTLSDVTVRTEQRDPTKTPNDEFLYVDIAAVDNASKTIIGAERITGADSPSRARKVIRAGDVIVATVRPNLNAVALVPEELDNQLCSTGFSVLRPSESATSEYLFAFVRSPFFIDHLVARTTGANYPAVADQDIRAVPITMPPIEVQRRLMKLLDEADELRKLRSQADRRVVDLIPALFNEMFGEPVTNERNWKRNTLGTFLSGIDSGWSPTCLDRSASDDEWGVLKLGSATTCVYRDTENKALPDSVSPRPEIEVQAGDLLFTRKNTYDLVGAPAYVFQTRPKLMMSDLIFRLRIDKNADLNPIFLWGLLAFPPKRKQLQSLASGSAGSMPNISKARLMTLPIEVPPLSLQEEYATRIIILRDLQDEQGKSREKLDALFQSMLHRAFAGEL